MGRAPEIHAYIMRVAVKIDRIGSQPYFWLRFFFLCGRLVLKPQTVAMHGLMVEGFRLAG
ncbi:hypothetical protein RB213_008376 [Colletotrichum asianum]